MFCYPEEHHGHVFITSFNSPSNQTHRSEVSSSRKQVDPRD